MALLIKQRNQLVNFTLCRVSQASTSSPYSPPCCSLVIACRARSRGGTKGGLGGHCPNNMGAQHLSCGVDSLHNQPPALSGTNIGYYCGCCNWNHLRRRVPTPHPPIHKPSRRSCVNAWRSVQQPCPVFNRHALFDRLATSSPPVFSASSIAPFWYMIRSSRFHWLPVPQGETGSDESVGRNSNP